MSSVFTSKKSIVIGVIVFILLFMQIGAFAGRDWKVITHLPTERRGFATAVVDNKVYLIGGSLVEDVHPLKIVPGPFGISTVEVYDPQTNRWRRRADMPTPRMGVKAAVVNGVIYVFGGFRAKDNKIANTKFPVRVDAYDPETDTWIRKQDMPVPRINFGLGVVAGKVYIIGGRTRFGGERTDRVDIYSPVTNTWLKGSKMPTRRAVLGVETVDDRIYAMGGRGWPADIFMGGPFLTAIEEYDPETFRWRQKPDMLDVRLEFSSIVVRDNIYLIGGFVWEDGVPKDLATVDVYHPQTEEWSDIPEMPTPIRPSGAAAVNGKIYVFGGMGERFEFSSDVVMFDTGFRAVEVLGKLLVRWGELKSEQQRQP